MLAFILALSLTAAGAQEPIGLYDLTPTLGFDPQNPAQVAATWDAAHVAASLQGIVNRDAPRLYLRFVENYGRNIDDYWLDLLSRPEGWLAGRKRTEFPDITALLKHYRKHVKGVVVYDPNVAATSNLASTIAGVEDLIAVRYDPAPESLYSLLTDPKGPLKLPVVRRLLHEDGAPLFTGRGTIPGTDLASTGSAKCDAYLWLKHHYLDTGKVDAGYAGYYIDQFWRTKPAISNRNQHTLTNHDFFIAKRGFFFDLHVWGDEAPTDDPQQKLGTDLETLKALMTSAYEHAGRERMIHVGGFTPWAYKYTTSSGGTHGDVPTEWETSRVLSAYNAFIDADAISFAAMANASFFMHYPLRDAYPQKWTTQQQLIERGLLTADGKVNLADREFIIFYVGDYDAAAWIYQAMPGIWNHPARGKIPLMWCITPIAERRAAPMLDYIRRTASPNDYFACADNGAGYLNPGMLQAPRPISELPDGLDAWARHCEPFYQRWGLTITGFIIDGFCPGLNQAGLDAYARFSPNGIVPQKVPATLLHGDMPVLRAGHDLGEDPAKAAELILERVEARTIPFHWFRAVLKGPDWYVNVYESVKQQNPKIELLDGPTFFELYRRWLQQTPEAAAGRLDCPR